jgi:hypothetical protein
MTEKRVNEKAKKHFSGHQLTTSILVNEWSGSKWRGGWVCLLDNFGKWVSGVVLHDIKGYDRRKE